MFKKIPRKERAVYSDIYSWWERRRWLFNLIVLLPILNFLYFYLGKPAIFFQNNDELIQYSVRLVFVLNLFYTFIWLKGIVAHYFFKTKGLATVWRWIFFGLFTFLGLFYALLATSFW